MEELKLFNNNEIRTFFDESIGEYYFSIIDIISVLTESDYKKSQNYRAVLKYRLKKEESQLITNCKKLNLKSKDGKMRDTDCLDLKNTFRLIEEISSKKAEPFKIWLAQLGKDRVDEIFDPEKAISRAITYYRNKGYSEEWITNRLISIKIRKELIDEWKNSGINLPIEYAILTNELTKAWSNLTIKEYKKLKNLTKENLRDNMSEIELALNHLAELTVKNLMKSKEPKTFKEDIDIVKKGGRVANKAKESYEDTTGIKVVTSKNLNDFKIKELDEKNKN